MKVAHRFYWGMFRDLFTQAWSGLADHRLRTLLSILGIAIGIAAVILIGVISEGSKQKVFSELQTFGVRSAWLIRDRDRPDPNRVERQGSGITNRDLQAIEQSGCCNGLAMISPSVWPSNGDPVRASREGRRTQTQLGGVNEMHLAINRDELIVGRNFSKDEVKQGRYYAIIGDKVQKELFPNEPHPIGEELRVGRMRVTVIGVLKPKDRSFLSSMGGGTGLDANSQILVPYPRIQHMNGNDEINMLQFQLDEGVDISAADQLKALLWRRHKGAFNYRTEGMSTYVATARNILNGVSMVGLLAAAVSLVVAGLGILNIMSTSVLERTREIGLRKALGGSSRDILMQFLIEAFLISFAGGVLGLILGGGFSILITSLVGLQMLPSAPLIVAALLVSGVVGIMAGYLPAYRAAQLKPVEALRYE